MRTVPSMEVNCEDALSGTSVPVAVVIQREEAQHRGWTFPRWQALGVVVGEQVASERLSVKPLHGDGRSGQYLWSGLQLELYKDSAESYWYNLVGAKPSLYVVCRAEDDNNMQPVLITADHDEANAYLETDDTVLSVDMPAEIYKWLERYVVETYKPQERKKRKRQ